MSYKEDFISINIRREEKEVVIKRIRVMDNRKRKEDLYKAKLRALYLIT
jgi:hypothetical protein